MPSMAANSAALPAFPVMSVIRSSIGAFLSFSRGLVTGQVRGHVILRGVDVEPVAGEAAEPDDTRPGRVPAAAADCDGVAVADGAGELPPPQVDGIGVAAGEQAEHAGEQVPQVRVGDLPGHGDVLGLDGEGAGQLVGGAGGGVAEPDGGDDAVGGLQGGPAAADDEVGGVVLVAEDPAVALVLAALPGAGDLGEA